MKVYIRILGIHCRMICLTNNKNIDFMKKDLLKNYVLCNKDNDTVGVNYKI